jgi:hypothetical protein
MTMAKINGHNMYYEVLGQGDPILCMGGWGTFCHDNHHHLARGLTIKSFVSITAASATLTTISAHRLTWHCMRATRLAYSTIWVSKMCI